MTNKDKISDIDDFQNSNTYNTSDDSDDSKFTDLYTNTAVLGGHHVALPGKLCRAAQGNHLPELGLSAASAGK